MKLYSFAIGQKHIFFQCMKRTLRCEKMKDKRKQLNKSKRERNKEERKLEANNQETSQEATRMTEPQVEILQGDDTKEHTQ